MKLVVGLGNPSEAYSDTRHNLGFRVVDLLAERWGCGFRPSKFKALLADARVAQHKVSLAKPQTYMNCSGEAVGPLARYFDIPPEDVVVVYDDVDLPLGQLRLRAQGSAGTHNGMRSLVQHLGTTVFPRLRIGIGRNLPGRDLTGHVLGRFTPEERPAIVRALARAADCVERILAGEWNEAMTEYNGRLGSLETAQEEQGP